MKNRLLQAVLFSFISQCCAGQCLTSPDSVMAFSRETRLSNYCGDIDAYDKGGTTILMMACLAGTNIKLIEDCLQRKPDIFKFQRLDSGFVPTEYYTYFNSCHYITFPALLEPLEPRAPSKSEKDKLKILKLFLKYYPNDSEKICFYVFESLLRYDNYCNNKKLFAYLKTRVNLDSIDASGNSYLHTAIRYRKKDNAIWLCKQGLSNTAKNKNNQSPEDLVNQYYEGENKRMLLNDLQKASKK